MTSKSKIEDDEIVSADGDFGPFFGAVRDEVVHGTYRRLGTWAPDLLDLLTGDLLSAGGTLLDIGANIGLVAIPATERCDVTTIAFEPDPRNAELLRRNVALHGLADRILVHEKALWSSDGKMSLRRDPKNHGDQRLVSPYRGEDSAPTVVVSTAILDRLLPPSSLSQPLVMKLDTQGAEVDILRGARCTLPLVEHLICEVWPSGLKRLDRPLGDLVELLASEFSHAHFLLNGEAVWPLRPLREEFSRLDAVIALYEEDTYFDILVGRRSDAAR